MIVYGNRLTSEDTVSGKQPKRKLRAGVDEHGRIPLHYAASDGDFDRLLQLIESGSAIDAQDDDGWTALHFAAQGGHRLIIDELLRRGANLHLVNSHGNDSLSVALLNARGDFTIVKILLSAGADPDLKNAYGQSFRDTATIMGLDQKLFH